MRLFEIDYACALCGRMHTAESYFTGAGSDPAIDLDSLHAGTMATLKDELTMLEILKGHAMVTHHDQGNPGKGHEARRGKVRSRRDRHVHHPGNPGLPRPQKARRPVADRKRTPLLPPPTQSGNSSPPS